MKNLFVLLIIIVIFLGCAVLGFNVMSYLDQERALAQPAVVQTLRPGNQHDFVLIQVDELTSASPKLVSAWFISLFATETHPPTLTLTQIYPSEASPDRDQALVRAFALDEFRNPVPDFWKELKVFMIDWEAYLMIDSTGIESVVDWLKVTQGLDPVSQNILTDSKDSLDRMHAACQAISLQSSQPSRTFSWAGLIPDHFQSNIRMEVGLAYWERAMNSQSPMRCEAYQSQ